MGKRKPVHLPPIVIHTDMPCKNGQPFVAGDGSCMRCGADQGVHGYACGDTVLSDMAADLKVTVGPAAASIAEMIIEIVATADRFGRDWQPTVGELIELRLQRFSTVTAAASEMLEALRAEANADRAQANYERLCSGLSEADEATVEDAGVFALERRQVARELRTAAIAKAQGRQPIAWACTACNSPRSVDPCPKCGTPLTKPADGWEWPSLPDIDRIRALAREVGYAIGVHGSLERDLDLIAAPWVAEAVTPTALAEHIARGLGGVLVDLERQDKPCGRWACNIHTPDWTKMIDLSVMPPASSRAERQQP